MARGPATDDAFKLPATQRTGGGFGSLRPPGDPIVPSGGQRISVAQPAEGDRDAQAAPTGTGFTNEYAASHPVPPNTWRATVVSVSGSTAVVTLSGDTNSISVPLEVSGVTANQTVNVTFRDNGGVALTAIIQ